MVYPATTPSTGLKCDTSHVLTYYDLQPDTGQIRQYIIVTVFYFITVSFISDEQRRVFFVGYNIVVYYHIGDVNNDVNDRVCCGDISVVVLLYRGSGVYHRMSKPFSGIFRRPRYDRGAS